MNLGYLWRAIVVAFFFFFFVASALEITLASTGQISTAISK